ncbi:MAG: response regulator transcription factor [Geminicoccaceae bacterium]
MTTGTAAGRGEQRASGRTTHRSTSPPDDAAIPCTAEIQAELREAVAAAAEAADRAHAIAAHLEQVLAAIYDARSTPMPPATPLALSWREAEQLSPREREVLALVAGGRTNKAIAEVLYVSPNTVKTHVTALLHKLRAESRVQLAAIATQHGLP